MQPKLIVEQKITPFVNKYAVYQATANGSKAKMVAFAQQKRLAFREQVTFYSAENSGQPAFTLRAEKVMDIHGRYFVEDADGQLIGAFKKEFAQSLINSTWNILDANNQPAITIKESNAFLAILRRFGGFVPFVGAIVELITAFFRYHFDLLDASSLTLIGKYEKTTLFRDHYLLSVDDKTYARTDWRVFAAQAVALDALQGR